MCVVVIREAIVLLIAINTFIAPLVEQEKNKNNKNVSLSVNTTQLLRGICITLVVCSQSLTTVSIQIGTVFFYNDISLLGGLYDKNRFL